MLRRKSRRLGFFWNLGRHRFTRVVGRDKRQHAADDRVPGKERWGRGEWNPSITGGRNRIGGNGKEGRNLMALRHQTTAEEGTMPPNDGGDGLGIREKPTCGGAATGCLDLGLSVECPEELMQQ